MVTVYHINNYVQYLQSNYIDEYKAVAKIKTNDLEEAYMLTQNLEESWIKNSKVKCNKVQDNYRSSSIGDIFEMDGIYYRVSMVGFKTIDKPINLIKEI